MNYRRLKPCVVLTVIGLISACATPYQPVPLSTPVPVAAEGHALKTDNVVIVLDASSSMAEGYGPYKKFDIATATVRDLIQTIPANMGINSALRSFGHDPTFSAASTVSLSKMSDFDRTALEQALLTVTKSGGPSPLCAALETVTDDLNGLDGHHALIIVSDGKDMDVGPIMAATALAEKFKDNLCIYPIMVGNDPNGNAQMNKLAQIGGCGVSLNADALANGQQMADYVSNIFIGHALDSDRDGVADAQDQCLGTPAGTTVDATGCPLDSDGDGVPDAQDQCLGTPAGTTVDATGCPLDSDGDGVPDALDNCPGTIAGVEVDASGCPLTVLRPDATTWTFNEISFDVGKANITPNSYPFLDEIAAALGARPQLTVIVEGHTDNTGSRATNMDLSQRRAQAVVDYLVGKGVSPSRVSAKGFGPDRPIADNATRLGRSKNRRVQFTKVE